MNAADQLLDISLLEEALSNESECRSRSHWVECTHTVTYLYNSCTRKDIQVCSDAHAYVIKAMERDGYCAECKRDCVDCWTIRPI